MGIYFISLILSTDEQLNDFYFFATMNNVVNIYIFVCEHVSVGYYYLGVAQFVKCLTSARVLILGSGV